MQGKYKVADLEGLYLHGLDYGYRNIPNTGEFLK